MNFKRKIERAKLPKSSKHYMCCGVPMLYKESYGEYICDICGKKKRAERSE